MADADRVIRDRRRRAEEIDRDVGRRIRERRLLLGMTQQQLAERAGVTYQQAHKYEAGITRLSAGMLATIARALDLEPGRLYAAAAPPAVPDAGPGAAQRPLLEMAREFARLGPSRQAAVVALVRALAEGEEDGRGRSPIH